MDILQYSYRPGHSTELALLTVQDLLWRSLELGQCSMLILTDLSSAFDTVDHTLLLRRLQTRFGIEDTALAWIRSYLENRSFKVAHNGAISSTRRLSCGVPQGSVMGPILFNCFVTPLGDLIKSMDGSTHVSFADDLQLVVSDSSPTLCIERATKYVQLIRSWLVDNGLAFNDTKLELLPFKYTPPTNDYALNIGNVSCSPKTHLKDLGVILDSDLSMELWVSSTVKCCFGILRNLWPLRHHLSFESAKSIAHAHILSRLDYCNSLLVTCNHRLIARLQRVQNCTARFVYGVSQHCHTSQLIRDLHWLPIQCRIKFKALSTIHNALYSRKAPIYLKQSLSISLQHSPRELPVRLVQHSYKQRTGGRAFYYYAPDLWNSLPSHLRLITCHQEFRRKLKTFLF